MLIVRNVNATFCSNVGYILQIAYHNHNLLVHMHYLNFHFPFLLIYFKNILFIYKRMMSHMSPTKNALFVLQGVTNKNNIIIRETLLHLNFVQTKVFYSWKLELSSLEIEMF